MSSIRDSVAGKEIEVCSFSEEELAHLTAWMTRLSMLIEVVDVVPQMDDTQGMKQTSVSVIVDALADRGRLGDLVEEKVCLAQHDVLAVLILLVDDYSYTQYPALPLYALRESSQNVRRRSV